MIITFTHAGTDFTVNTESLSAEAMTYLLNYGLKQSLSDSIAGTPKKTREAYIKELADGDTINESELAERTTEAELARMQKRFDDILAGTIGIRTPGTTRKGGLDAMIERVAAEMIRSAAKTKAIKIESGAMPGLVEKFLAKPTNAAKAREEAERRIAAAAIDTDDLF